MLRHGRAAFVRAEAFSGDRPFVILGRIRNPKRPLVLGSTFDIAIADAITKHYATRGAIASFTMMNCGATSPTTSGQCSCATRIAFARRMVCQ
jgi:hypothetical protein